MVLPPLDYGVSVPVLEALQAFAAFVSPARGIALAERWGDRTHRLETVLASEAGEANTRAGHVAGGARREANALAGEMGAQVVRAIAGFEASRCSSEAMFTRNQTVLHGIPPGPVSGGAAGDLPGRGWGG
jgi:hypothetical protein